ncbi:M12 family metallo-peptidase [Dyadobacter sp. CY312]|uniref:M12 family metallo-peptidase n=1 Tax=Dyadobacter sp. CY312 TaxID=2907303 RepID=UPI001F4465A1|nr:M12 family metallo-peptidase [Dyadobacter sp. CY312]MCE7038732.1 M12 family metallo-peptidase [Dyadobacter sp. CY312]
MISSSTYKLLIFCILLSFVTKSYGQHTAPACGTSDSTVASYLAKYVQKRDLTAARTSAGEKLEYRLALDINYQTYLLYQKDKELLTKTAYRFIQKASEIFEREINVKLVVTSILIWDKPEPYTLTQDYEYFDNVLQYWTNNRFEERDAVVSLSCRDGWFYGGGRMASSNMPRPNNPDLAVDLFCHELGHTLGSPHTQYCSWPGGPIDRCTNVENVGSDCQDGYLESTTGTLMSYCRSILSFHPLCRNLMRDYAEGKIDTFFKLNSLTATPDTPLGLKLSGGLSNSPAFEWKATFKADKFRIQLAKDQAFTQIIEDTLVNQPFFQTNAHPEGTYYVRVNAKNLSGQSPWSEIVTAAMPPFSENSIPPILSNVTLWNNNTVTGNFRTFEGIDAYQIRLTPTYGDGAGVTHERNVGPSSIQSFVLPSTGDVAYYFQLQLRVRKNQMWSRWSEPRYMTAPWSSYFYYTTNLANTSDKPVMDVQLASATFPIDAPLVHQMEVAEDSEFKNIVFSDSVATNEPETRYTDRATYVPQLREKTSYYVRTRVKWSFDKYSGWSTYQLNTGNEDTRFQHIGTPSKELRYSGGGGGDHLKNRFFSSDNKLFVFDKNRGYYATSDLKSWEKFSSHATQGKSPNSLSYFGAKDDEIFAIDPLGTLVTKTNNVYATHYSLSYLNSFGPIAVTKDEGIFFASENTGVINFKDNSWTYYGQNNISSNRALFVTADSESRIWAIMEGGSVWSYKNLSWKMEPLLQNWTNLYGIVTDHNNTLYAYGDWGVMRLDPAGQRWENIPSLSGYPVRKVIFDKQNQMWIASYKFNGTNFSPFALIKYKDEKANIYYDGLNLTNEPFDITYFKDQLLILSNSGEIHSFDESNVLRIDPKTNYCAGEELTVSVASNSTFAKENRTSFLLHNTQNQETTPMELLRQDGNRITTTIPATISEGTYNLNIMTTSPELKSNFSGNFSVYSLLKAEITSSQSSSYKTTLKTNEVPGFAYQWQLDGVDLPNAAASTLSADRSGSYSVTITNQGGCKTNSAAVSVVVDEPREIMLLQNVPNPVGAQTEIAFYLPAADNIKLELFNTSGKKMLSLGEGNFQRGWHFAKVNGAQLANGIYIYRLTAGTFTKSLQMVK